MKINKNKLVEALSIVKPGLDSKKIIEQASCFLFQEGYVITYNDEISVRHPIDVEISGAVPAEELYKLLTKIKAEEITLTLEDNILLFSTARSKAGLTLQQQIKLPIDEIDKITAWKTLPTNFTKCVRLAMKTCSSDASRPVLTAVDITKNGYVQASDGFRILKAILNKEMPVDDFLLPAHISVDVVAFNPVKIALGSGWVHFKNEKETVMSCRIFEEQYPDCSSHFNVKGEFLQLPKTLDETVARASIFSKRDSLLEEKVSVHIGGKKIVIRGESEAGWFEETAKIRYDKPSITFSIAPYLLQDILKETSTCTIGENLLKFETDEWQYVALIHS